MKIASQCLRPVGAHRRIFVHAALFAACVLLVGPSRTCALGLVYVDANNDDDFSTGTFGPNANLSPPTAFSLGFTPDNLWGTRTALGAESPTLGRFIWEAGGTAAGSAVEDVPEITQTISGLTANASYDVYVAYWSSNGANWGIRAGLASGNYQLFDRTGAVGAIAGTRAGSAIWTTPPLMNAVPIYTEADRAMFLGKVGTASANGLGRLSVFLNDRPNTTDADRTWLDGLAYAPADTAITLTATVARGTGNLSIVNSTGEPLHFTGYTITSTNSALKPAGWLSIQDNYVGVGPGKLDSDPWFVSAPTLPYPPFAGALTEAESGFDGATLANGGGVFNLGNVWARSPFEDFQVQFTLVGGNTLTLSPQFTGTAVATGDFDASGTLNLADYLTLRNNMHTDLTTLGLSRIEAYGRGDVTGDNLVNHGDFLAFRASYIQVNGPAAFAEIAGVPEPTGALLAALAAFAPTLLRTRKRSLAICVSAAGNMTPTPHGPYSTTESATVNREHTRRMRRLRPMVRPLVSIALTAIALLTLTAPARAETVSGWGLETGITGATLTEGVAGAFSVTAPTANAGPRALLTTPISFANVGDLVQFSGTVTLSNAPGNQQFRFGLYNTNAKPTGTLSAGVWTGADPTGWLGYMLQLGGSNGNDSLKGRNVPSGNSWLANAESYIVGNGPAAAPSPPAATPYTFTITLARTGATTVRTDYSFVGGTTNRFGSFVDNNLGSSVTATSYSAVGFLLNGNTGAAQFTNVKVEVPKILRLRVNTTTGFVSIANKDAAATITPNYYEITSVGNALAPASWLSLDGDLPATTTTWEKAGGADADTLSETNLLGSLAFTPQGPYAALGKAFANGGAQDLVFRYILTDGTLQTGFVEYVAGGPAGDFDVDDDVDGRDFLVWQRGVGTAFTPANLTDWRNTFGTVSASPSTGAVPEPSTASLAMATSILCAAGGRGRKVWFKASCHPRVSLPLGARRHPFRLAL